MTLRVRVVFNDEKAHRVVIPSRRFPLQRKENMSILHGKSLSAVPLGEVFHRRSIMRLDHTPDASVVIGFRPANQLLDHCLTETTPSQPISLQDHHVCQGDAAILFTVRAEYAHPTSTMGEVELSHALEPFNIPNHPVLFA